MSYPVVLEMSSWPRKFVLSTYFLRGRLNSLLPIFFALVYTSVVLPFTVSFFRSIVSVPEAGVKLFFLIPLEQAHVFMLPFFLGSLEFASFRLACSFWAKSEYNHKILFLFLFLVCQAFAVFSVFFDIRNRAFKSEEQAQLLLFTESLNGKDTRIVELKQLIADKRIAIAEISKRTERLEKSALSASRDLAGNQQEIDSLTRDIDSALSAGKRGEEIPIQRAMRTTLENERRELNTARRDFQKGIIESEQEVGAQSRALASFEEELRTLVADRADFVQKQRLVFAPKSELAFVGGNFWTAKGVPAVLVALLFPITLLGMGFVFRDKNINSEKSSSLDIEKELVTSGSLPKEGHLLAAKQLAPVVATYLLALRASKEMSASFTTYHLQDDMKRLIIEAASQLKEQVIDSSLDPQAQQYLLGSIDESLSQQLKDPRGSEL